MRSANIDSTEQNSQAQDAEQALLKNDIALGVYRDENGTAVFFPGGYHGQGYRIDDLGKHTRNQRAATRLALCVVGVAALGAIVWLLTTSAGGTIFSNVIRVSLIILASLVVVTPWRRQLVCRSLPLHPMRVDLCTMVSRNARVMPTPASKRRVMLYGILSVLWSAMAVGPPSTYPPGWAILASLTTCMASSVWPGYIIYVHAKVLRLNARAGLRLRPWWVVAGGFAWWGALVAVVVIRRAG